METIYKEYSCARWNFWTYADGLRYSLTEKQFNKMLSQGCKQVIVKQERNQIMKIKVTWSQDVRNDYEIIVEADSIESALKMVDGGGLGEITETYYDYEAYGYATEILK